jgi:acyl-CoA thioesterase
VVTNVNNSDARGLVVGSLYDEAGALVASTAQEALWRV